MSKESAVRDRYVLYKVTCESERVVGGDFIGIAVGGTQDEMLAVETTGPRVGMSLAIGNKREEVKRAKRAANQNAGFVTSTVTEIVSCSESGVVFRTRNSTYELRIGMEH